MRLRHLALGLGALGLAAALAQPAAAEQTFWTYSTGSAPKPNPTATYPVGIDYLYYPCSQMQTNNGRFNPYGASSAGSGTAHHHPVASNCTSGHRHKPGPPQRRFPQTAPHPKPT